MSYTVYVHITPNGKYYVGITQNSVKRRWANGNGYKTQEHFYRAIQKYGWDNIHHCIVCDGITKEQAERFEQTLIKTYQSMNPEYGYNKTSGGDLGKQYSKEVKNKIGDSNSVSIEQFSIDGKFIMRFKSIAHVSKTLGYKSVSHISSVCKGKRKSAYGFQWRYSNHNDEVSNIKHSNIGQEKSIVQYSLSGKMIKRYRSIQHASYELFNDKRIGCGSIISCLKGISKKAYGYQWRYEREQYKENINEYKLDYKTTDKHRTNLSKALKGRIVTFETREKIALKQCKKVIQKDLENKIIKIHISANKASDDLLGSVKGRKHIQDCCNGKRKTAYGHRWEYAEDTP